MLQSIYNTEGAGRILYDLLAERTPEQSISHKEMPTHSEHRAFINSQPYMCWYIIIMNVNQLVGAVYLTKNREVGIGVLKEYQGRGYAKKAVKELIERHPGKFLANIAPTNYDSNSFFQHHFHGELIQVTYECSL